MKFSAANIIAAVLILVGAIWSLQGANILPGSPMTGDIKWLIFGIIFIIIGIALLVWRNRRNDDDSGA